MKVTSQVVEVFEDLVPNPTSRRIDRAKDILAGIIQQVNDGMIDLGPIAIPASHIVCNVLAHPAFTIAGFSDSQNELLRFQAKTLCNSSAGSDVHAFARSIPEGSAIRKFMRYVHIYFTPGPMGDLVSESQIRLAFGQA